MKPFSLALGWWAARGLAHIGVIKYLEESNLRASEISGTSMGAIIAALYACGKSSDDMHRIARDVRYLSLIDMDMRRGILRGKKIRNFFADIFGDLRIEELRVPLKIVSTDIVTGERYVFHSGSVVEALRSSVSIPGVITPNIIDRSEFVDGGLVNNLPVEVLDGHNVLAVSVLKDTARPLKNQFQTLGFTFNHGIFSMGYQILQKSIEIMVKQNEDRSIHCGKNVVYLRPEFPGVDYYEFYKHEKIIKIGYDAATKSDILGKMRDTFESS